MRSHTVLAAGISMGLAFGACAESDNAQPDTINTETISTPGSCVVNYFVEVEPVELSRAETVLADVIAFAESINVPELKEVVDFAKNNTTTNFLSEDKTEFVILEAGRDYGCDFTTFVANSPSFGVFNREADVVIMNTEEQQPVSDFWNMLTIMHELKHAMNHAKNGQNSDPFEEVNTRIFEQKVVADIGGQPYSDYLETVKQKYVAAGFSQAGGWAINIGAANLMEDDAALDSIFGPALSEREKRIRATAVSVHAVFELIDANAFTLGDPTVVKDTFMRGVTALPMN